MKFVTPDRRRLFVNLATWRRAASVPLFALMLASALLIPTLATAHEEPYSFVEVRIDSGAVRGRVTAHVVDLAHEGGFASSDSLFAGAYVQQHLAVLQRLVDDRFHLRLDGHAPKLEWSGFEIVRSRKSVAFDWRAAERDPATIEISGPLFPYDPPHETYVNVFVGDTLMHQDLIDAKHKSARYTVGARQSPLKVAGTFLVQGVHHIFIGPDHILFVIGLMLLGGSLPRLLKIVTSFTIAHTLTLVLATLGIVNPPPRLVEPAIALSIIYIGFETLWALKRQRDARARIAFGFGLVHGFGFAGVLREFGLPSSALGWALGSFNVGVEVGQACIVLAVAPLLAWVQKRDPQVARRIVTAMSVVIIAAGTYWFVQRLLAA